jgi:hypothetical protein
MTQPALPIELSALIEQLIEREGSGTSAVPILDTQVVGLPVYADAGGVLLLTPAGNVLRLDSETGEMTEETDWGWRALAITRAARKFPELAALRPSRPQDAVTCRQCDGAGLVLGQLDCGTCYGLGWIRANMVQG